MAAKLFYMISNDNFKDEAKAIAEAKERSKKGDRKFACVIQASDKTFWVETTSFTRVNETLIIQFEDGKELK